MRKSIGFFSFVAMLFLSSKVYSDVKPSALSQTPHPKINSIVTLAPHLTEWVYALGLEDRLVGVSAYSDYPTEASQKTVVADANGINFKALLQLNPDLILAWEGGNKSQELARLETLGFKLFRSSPTQLDDIGTEIQQLGNLLGESAKANRIQHQFATQLGQLRENYTASSRLPVFFYLWTKPMMSIGKNAWANKVLGVCNAHTIFVDSPTDYPEVRMAEVLIRQPKVLITTVNTLPSEQASFWQPHRNILNAPIVQVDGTIINRFTPRITDEIISLCESLR